MAVLDVSERAALERADHDLFGLQEALEAAAHSNALDVDLLQRLATTAREAAARLNQDLPIHVDPDARDEIRRRLIDLLTLAPSDDLRPLDVADLALVQAEAVRHVMRDLLDEQPPTELRRAGAAIAMLEAWLPSLTLSELSGLVGLSERQIQRRRRDEATSTPRLQIVTRLVAILRHAWSDQGVYLWFTRPRPDLDGRAPVDLLDDPARERSLLIAARSGRVQGGV